MCVSVDLSHFFTAFLLAKWGWKLLVVAVVGLLGLGSQPMPPFMDPYAARRSIAGTLTVLGFFITRWAGLALWESLRWAQTAACQEHWSLWLSGPLGKAVLAWLLPLSLAAGGAWWVARLGAPPFLRFTSGHQAIDRAVNALRGDKPLRFEGFYPVTLVAQNQPYRCALLRKGSLGVSPKVLLFLDQQGRVVREPGLAWRLLWLAQAAWQLGFYDNIRQRAHLHDRLQSFIDNTLPALAKYQKRIRPALHPQNLEAFEQLTQALETLTPWFQNLKEDLERLGQWADELHRTASPVLWDEQVAKMEAELKALRHLREHPEHLTRLEEAAEAAQQLQAWLKSRAGQTWREGVENKRAQALEDLLTRWLEVWEAWKALAQRDGTWRPGWFTVEPEDWKAWCDGVELAGNPRPPECGAPPGGELPGPTRPPLVPGPEPPALPPGPPSSEGEGTPGPAPADNAASPPPAADNPAHTAALAPAIEARPGALKPTIVRRPGPADFQIAPETRAAFQSPPGSDAPPAPAPASTPASAANPAASEADCPPAPPTPTAPHGRPLGPADLAFLLHGKRINTPAVVVATMLDLARRGYVWLESISYPATGDEWRRQARWRRNPQQNREALRPYEAWLLETLFPHDMETLSMGEFYRLMPGLVPEMAARVEENLRQHVVAAWGLGWPLTVTVLVALVGGWALGWAALFALEGPLAHGLSPRWATNLVLLGGCIWSLAVVIGIMPLIMALERRALRPRDPAVRRWVRWWEQVGEPQGAAFWLQHQPDAQQAQRVANRCLLYYALSVSTLITSGALGAWLEAFASAFPQLTLPWWHIYAPREGEMWWSPALAKYAASSLPVMMEVANYPAMMRDITAVHPRLRHLYRTWQRLFQPDEPDEAPASPTARLPTTGRPAARQRLIPVAPQAIRPAPEPQMPTWLAVARYGLRANTWALLGMWGLLLAALGVSMVLFDPAPWGFVPHIPLAWDIHFTIFAIYTAFTLVLAFLMPNEYEWRADLTLGGLVRNLAALVGFGIFFAILFLGLLGPIVNREIFHALHHIAVWRGAWQSVQGPTMLTEAPRLEPSATDDDEDALQLVLQVPPTVWPEDLSLEIKAYALTEEERECWQGLPRGARGVLQGRQTAFGLEVYALTVGTCTLTAPAYHPDLP